MNISNYELVSTRRPFEDIEADIRSLLLGAVDVRLEKIGSYRALLRKHIVRALKLQYPDKDPWDLINSTGVSAHREVTENETAVLLKFREEKELQAKTIFTPVTGDKYSWHLSALDVPKAWTLQGGPANINWRIKIGQIDTGYTKHTALGFDNHGVSPWLLIAECRNFFLPPISDDLSPIAPYEDPSGTDTLTGGSAGHGTKIGSTISGYQPKGDNGLDFFGAAPKVPHVMVRISNCVWINDQVTAFARALNYLVNVAGVSIVNVSMGIYPRHLNGEARSALNDAYQKGVIVVCAAGNHIDSVVSPAFNRRTIAVGGVTSNDQVWSGTSYGTTVDWAAPASDIRRAVVKGKKFGFASGGDGTSYAAALTTGVAALWLNHHATSINQYPELWQRVEAFKTLGKLTSRKPENWKSGVVGEGVLNAFNLITAHLPHANSLTQEPAL